MQLKNIHNQLIAAKAKEKGITCHPLVPGLEDILVLRRNGQQILINKTRSHKLSFMAGFITKDKAACNLLLQAAGIPIPPFVLASGTDDALLAFVAQHRPVVVKPYNTNRGIAVCMDVQHPAQLEAALQQVRTVSKYALVQQQVPGNDYRVLVIDGKVEGVLHNEWPSVTGNGMHTIDQLVNQLNSSHERSGQADAHGVALLPIAKDAKLNACLVQQGRNLQTVLAKGEAVQLGFEGNVWCGAIPVDVTDQVHPDNAALAIETAALLQVDVAGIDIRCMDIALPYDKQPFAVIEVNVLPGMSDHVYPARGQSRDVIGAYIDYLFKSA